MISFTPTDPATATATGKTADILAETKKTLGGTPNMTKMMAINPAVLKGWLSLNSALGDGDRGRGTSGFQS